MLMGPGKGSYGSKEWSFDEQCGSCDALTGFGDEQVRAAIGLLASADRTSVLDICSNVESRCAGERAAVNADDKKFKMACITDYCSLQGPRRDEHATLSVSIQRV